MEPQDASVYLSIVLTIVGAFGTIAVAINAFFLKGIYSDMNDIKVELSAMVTHSNDKDKRIDDLEENQKELFGRMNAIERQAKCFK